MVPALGERASMVTLSVSISATTPSASTYSPAFFTIERTVPSEIESPMAGTGTSSGGPPLMRARPGCHRTRPAADSAGAARAQPALRADAAATPRANLPIINSAAIAPRPRPAARGVAFATWTIL